MQIRLGLAAVFVTLAVALPATATASTGLGAFWQLNEGAGTTAKDVSGNANDGTLQGPAHVAARFGRGLRFDGVDDEVFIPRSATLEPATVTVEAWVRSSVAPGAFKHIVSQGASGCEVASYGLYSGRGGGAAFYISNGGSGGEAAISPAAPDTIWDGAWHHVAGTYDGAAVRLFVDGMQVGGGTPATIPISYGLPNANGLLGAFGGTCTLNWGGDLDEPRIWRRALTAGEIAASAAMGDAATKRLAAQVGAGQAIVYSSRFSSGDDMKISIESATGDERIKSVRIHQVLPLGAGAGCGGLVSGQCRIVLLNDGRTAKLTVTRRSLDSTVTLRVDLRSGRTLYVDVTSEQALTVEAEAEVRVST